MLCTWRSKYAEACLIGPVRKLSVCVTRWMSTGWFRMRLFSALGTQAGRLQSCHQEQRDVMCAWCFTSNFTQVGHWMPVRSCDECNSSAQLQRAHPRIYMHAMAILCRSALHRALGELQHPQALSRERDNSLCVHFRWHPVQGHLGTDGEMPRQSCAGDILHYFNFQHWTDRCNIICADLAHCRIQVEWTRCFRCSQLTYIGGQRCAETKIRQTRPAAVFI